MLHFALQRDDARAENLEPSALPNEAGLRADPSQAFDILPLLVGLGAVEGRCERLLYLHIGMRVKYRR